MKFAFGAFGLLMLCVAIVAALITCAANAQTDDPNDWVSYWWTAGIAAVAIALLVGAAI